MLPYNEKRCNLELMSVEILHNLNDGNLGCLNSFRFSIWGFISQTPLRFCVFPDFGYLKNLIGDMEGMTCHL